MIAENHRERGTLMLDFRVETFLAVCRHMNFTKAARELSITQPAVSHHIRYLEQAYGAALFRHNGKRLQLTEAGEILRRTLLTMKHDEQHLQKRMQQAATGTRDYSFGATLSVAEFMLNEALGRFLHLHPDSRIRMQVADTKVLLSKLDSGELDFAVVEGDFPKASMTFSSSARRNMSLPQRRTRPRVTGDGSSRRCWMSRYCCARRARARA